jgi:hypothetical protein
MKKIFVVLFLALIDYHCATVPITRRRQLSLISNNELLPMSYDNYKVVLDSSNLSGNRQQGEMVKRVGVRIQKAVEEFMAQNGASDQLENYSSEFNLINGNVANAWRQSGSFSI